MRHPDLREYALRVGVPYLAVSVASLLVAWVLGPPAGTAVRALPPPTPAAAATQYAVVAGVEALGFLLTYYLGVHFEAFASKTFAPTPSPVGTVASALKLGTSGVLEELVFRGLPLLAAGFVLGPVGQVVVLVLAGALWVGQHTPRQALPLAASAVWFGVLWFGGAGAWAVVIHASHNVGTVLASRTARWVVTGE